MSRQRTPRAGRNAAPATHQRASTSRSSKPVPSPTVAKGSPGTVEGPPETGDETAGLSWRPIALGAICLAGIGISIYLLIVHYQPSALFSVRAVLSTARLC